MIGDLRLYQNTGYTIGGHHVCRRGATLPDDQGRVFPHVKMSFGTVNTVDLAINYCDAITYTYIKYSIDQNDDPTDQEDFYGWIVDVKLISTKTTEICRIYWQWDHWRTWGDKVTLGSGRLTRQKTCSKRPDNVKRGIYQITTSMSNITDLLDDVYHEPNQDYFYRQTQWIVLQYILKTGSNPTKTEIKTILWPCTTLNTMADLGASSAGDIKIGALREDAYGGLIEDLININPEDILGAWITPVCPFPSAFRIRDMSQGYQAWTPANVNTAEITIVNNYAYFTLKNAESVSIPTSNTITIPGEFLSNTPEKSINISDFNGNIIWAMPFGLTIQNRGNVGFSFSPISGQMIVHFYSTGSALEYTRGAAEGLVAQIMLPTLPISSNTWQSYVLSGQREYEIESAKAANNAAYTKGITNIGTGAIEGAIAGSIAAPGVGTAIGAVAGLGLSLIGNTIGHMTDEQLRERVQDLRDMAVQNQNQSLLIPGQSSFWIQSGEEPKFIIMESVDNGEYAADASENGYHTDMMYQSCESLVPIQSASGPIQIEKLDVTGPVPISARLAIKDMFQKGVYID